jgi:hypothetical protein
VNGPIGDGRAGDADRGHGGLPPRPRRCRRRESFEGQKRHRGEFRSATEGNVVNPKIGSGLQDGRGVVEEETVEVVRNHEDGTRMGSGIPIPKGGRDGAGTLRTRPPGRRTPRRTNDGGAFFGQPQERKPGVKAGSQGLERVGDGAKVRRVTRTITFVSVLDPVDGSSEVPRAATRTKGQGGRRRTASEPRRRSDFLPTQVEPVGAGRGAYPRVGARARLRRESWAVAHAAAPTPAVRGRRRCSPIACP